MDKKASVGFSRYGDGEYLIMKHRAVNAEQDSWKIGEGDSLLAADLLESLKGLNGSPFFYGFPSNEGIESLQLYFRVKEKKFN